MKRTFLLLLWFNVVLSFGQKSSKDSTYVFYFKSAKAKLPADSLLQFQKFYKKFELCTTCLFDLKGFTDSVGSEAYNFKLSQQRIDYVKSLLLKHPKTQILELPLGEKLAQKTKNNQNFRKVILNVSIVKKEINKEKILTSTDSLSPNFKRFMEFKKVNTAIRLNILFHLNTVDILKDSEKEVEILAHYLLENYSLKAKLLGHVCCLNNFELSQKRALKIKDLLVKKGVDESRLTAEGFGNRRPIVNEYTREDEQINRRVEVIFFE